MADLAAFALLAFTSLLAIVNPLSAVPLYLAVTAGYDAGHRRRTLRLAVLTAIGILVAFGVLGTWILTFFGITTDAFRIAGGILFIGVGSDMLAARRARNKTTAAEEEEAELQDEVGIIPLGMPTLAGPGAMTTVITLVAQPGPLLRRGLVFVAIVAVMLLSWAVLSVAPTLLRRFGRTGLNVMTRVMGLIVMVIGVQFVIDGVRAVAVGILRAR
ncbi:MAG TPA: MarC family protein [Gemmatirosa sp.]|nr:MarC family protein [Gemmatirosa sp.]